MPTKMKTTIDPHDKWNFGRGRTQRKSRDREDNILDLAEWTRERRNASQYASYRLNNFVICNSTSCRL